MREQTARNFPTGLDIQRGPKFAATRALASHRSQAFNLLLGTAVGLHLLFDGTYIIQGLAYSNFIKFGILGLVVVLALRDGGPLGRPAIIVITGYALLSLQGILVVPISENIGDSLWGAEKFLYRSLFTFWALSKCFGSRVTNNSIVINTWLGMAAYFSVAGILVFVLVHLLQFTLPTVYIDLPRIGGGKPMIIGLGFAEGLPRIQSFFSEANKFAQFLVIPFFVLLSLKGTARNRVLLLVVAGAFALTFSGAATLGLLFGLVLWVSLRAEKKSQRWALLGGGTLLIALSAIFIAQNLWATYEFQGEQDLYYRTVMNKYTSLESSIENVRYGIQLANENIFGIGMIDRVDSPAYGYGAADLKFNTAGGIAQVLGRSGWAGMLIYGFVLVVVWRTLLWYAAEVRSGAGDPRGLALGVAYFALLIAASNFGPFDQRTLIVPLALFLAMVHRHKMLRQPE